MRETKRPTTAREPFVVDERIRKMIAGAVAEVDPVQIAALRRLTPAERFVQMTSMMRFAEKASAGRLCIKEPLLDATTALKIVRGGQMIPWLMEHRKQSQRGK